MDDVMLLRAEEAGRVLAISRSGVYALIADGTLPAVRLGRSVRIPAAALHCWIEEHTRSHTPRSERVLPPEDEEPAAAAAADAPSLEGRRRREAVAASRNSARAGRLGAGEASR